MIWTFTITLAIYFRPNEKAVCTLMWRSRTRIELSFKLKLKRELLTVHLTPIKLYTSFTSRLWVWSPLLSCGRLRVRPQCRVIDLPLDSWPMDVSVTFTNINNLTRTLEKKNRRKIVTCFSVLRDTTNTSRLFWRVCSRLNFSIMHTN